MMTADSRNDYKWTQHPIISTVLWAVESATGGANKKEAPPPTSSTLKWKDDQAVGNNSLREYISQVQLPYEPSTEAREEEPSTQLRPGASRNRLADYDQDVMDNHLDCENGPAEVTTSPQWGFYVPITPPQPEMYASAPVEQKS